MTLQELRQRPHWSYSSLNQLLNICSLQWYFRKIAKLEPAHTSVNLVAGSVYHRTMDQIYLARKLEMPLELSEALELYTEDWRRSSKEEPIKYGKLSADEVEEQGRGLVTVAWNHIDPEERILKVSETFCVPVLHQGRFMSRPLIGEFDLVVEREGRPVVVDWKTSAARWAKDKARKSLQAAGYSYAYNLKHGVNPEVRFDVAVKNRTPVFERHVTRRDPGSWKLLGQLTAKAQEIVKHELYYPSLDSFACSDCPYADACAQWCRAEPLSVATGAEEAA